MSTDLQTVQAPEQASEALTRRFSFIGADLALAYAIGAVERVIRADERVGIGTSLAEYQLEELALVRDYIRTEAEERLGFSPFQSEEEGQ